MVQIILNIDNNGNQSIETRIGPLNNTLCLSLWFVMHPETTSADE